MSGDEFISARELNAAFHAGVIRPVLSSTPYAAGLLGWGSDVLGYDTARSTDHGWGLRLSIFVDADQVERIAATVEQNLPDTFDGHPVRFGWDAIKPDHHISVSTLGAWLTGQLAVDAEAGMTTRDWLLTPQQQLLGVVAGQVYADDGRLKPVREALSWYRTRSGTGSSPVSGGDSTRKSRSSSARPKWATTWAPASSHRAWFGI